MKIRCGWNVLMFWLYLAFSVHSMDISITWASNSNLSYNWGCPYREHRQAPIPNSIEPHENEMWTKCVHLWLHLACRVWNFPSRGRAPHSITWSPNSSKATLLPEKILLSGRHLPTDANTTWHIWQISASGRAGYRSISVSFVLMVDGYIK